MSDGVGEVGREELMSDTGSAACVSGWGFLMTGKTGNEVEAERRLRRRFEFFSPLKQTNNLGLECHNNTIQ